jgi:hypothetical protein
MNLKDGILVSCMKQIQNDNTVFNMKIDINHVMFSATRKKLIGEFELETDKFYELLSSQIDTQCIFSIWFGNAYNNLLEKEGGDIRLMC